MRRHRRLIIPCLLCTLSALGVTSCASHTAEERDPRYTPEEAAVWTVVFRDLIEHHPAPRAYLTVDRVEGDYVDPPREVFRRLSDAGVVLARASLLNDLPPLAQQPHAAATARQERTTVYTARIVSWDNAGDSGGNRAAVAHVEASYQDGALSGGGYELLVRKTADSWRATRTGKVWQF